MTEAIDEKINLAKTHFQNQNWADAKKICTELLSEDPKNISALQLQGIIHATLKEFDQAATSFTNAVELAPDSPMLHNNLANSLRGMGKNVDAIEEANKALALKPDYAQAHNTLGNIYTVLQDREQAEEHYKKAVDIKDDFHEARFNLGLHYSKTDQHQDAIAQFYELANQQPKNLAAHYHLANAYYQQDQLDHAIAAYKSVIRLDNSHTEAYNSLGVCFLKKEEPLEAIRCFATAIRTDETHSIALNNLAGTLLEQERFTEAARYYKEFLVLEPDDIDAQQNLGISLMASEENSEAILIFEKILNANPEHIDALTNLGTCFLRERRYPEATKHFEEVLKLQPDNKTVNYLLTALQKGEAPDGAPEEYVTNLFDNYAKNYDQHLSKVLKYQVPALLVKELKKVADFNSVNADLDILDLGCGTGLSGESLRPFAKHLVGVDLSPKMLRVAKAKNIYDELIAENINSVMAQFEKQFDLIVAADVLTYCGNLSQIFHDCARALRPSGLFAFSIEGDDEEPFHLTQFARYTHHRSYIENLAKECGFKIISRVEANIREQEGQPVKGELFILTS